MTFIHNKLIHNLVIKKIVTNYKLATLIANNLQSLINTNY